MKKRENAREVANANPPTAPHRTAPLGRYDDTLLSRLNTLVSTPFATISYTDAVALLQAEIAKDPSKWEFPTVEFGTDLATEHERWITETHFEGTPAFVYNYPKNIKAFYMRDNDDGKTVGAFDLLVPKMGELTGGSQREERLDVLEKKIVDMGMELEEYERASAERIEA